MLPFHHHRQADHWQQEELRDMGHQMPTVTGAAQLSVKPLLLHKEEMVSPLFFEQGKQAGSPVVESSAIFILGFLLPSFYMYIREPLETENYEVLLFRNDYESFYHCYTLKSLSSTLFEILGRVSL